MDYFASLSLAKLERMLDNEKNPAIRNKLLVLWHKKRGKSERYISSVLRLPRSTIGYWIRRFRKEDLKGFHRKPGSGGHNKYLTKGQERELQENLKEQPMTTKEVLVYIKERYDREYHPNSIPRLMKRLGQALITPRERHYEANPRSGWTFKGHIKKADTVEK